MKIGARHVVAGSLILRTLASGCVRRVKTRTYPYPVTVSAPDDASHHASVLATETMDIGSQPLVPGEWSYDVGTGPLQWSELDAAYRLCEEGEEQSPIDLNDALFAASNFGPLDLWYAPTSGRAVNTGHTVRFDVDSRGAVAFQDETYDLVQLHYHAPSEHTFNGRAMPVEFHFVHEDVLGNQLVLGVVCHIGAHNPAYDGLIRSLPASRDQAHDIHGDIDLRALLPGDLAYATYRGSLTQPPCTENVRWIVLLNSIELSDEQVAALELVYHGNNRPVQPVYGRTISVTP